MNFRWVVNHLAVSLKHHGWALLSVISVIAFSWTMGLTLKMTQQNFSTLMTLWGSSQELNFFLSDSLSSDQKKEIADKIQQDTRLADVKAFAGSDLLRELGDGRDLGGFSKMLEDIELVSMLPDGVQARLSPHIENRDKAQALKDIAHTWSGFPGITQATFGYDFSEQFRGLFMASDFILKCLIFCLALVSVVIAYQMTHLSISSRKSEVEVLEMIGASRRFIWAPFILEGALIGAISYACAVGAVGFGYQWIRETFEVSPWTRSIAENMVSMQAWEIIAFGCAAVLLNVLGSLLSLRRIHLATPMLREEVVE